MCVDNFFRNGLTAHATFLALVLCLSGSGCANRALVGENEALKAENGRLAHEITILNARNEDILRSRTGLRPNEIETFRKLGLKNPEQDIIDDLGGREDLMPVKGIFGARPSFYKDVRMYVLNSRWVYATFDVGEKLGQRLYEYTVKDGGEITWKVIETYIEGR